MLNISNITMRFSGLTALDNINMDVEKGEIRGLIGPNGSGKTTLINIISGFYTPSEGKIEFNGSTISSFSPNKIAEKGICRTFQNINLFSGMSVLENVVTASNTHQTAGLCSAIFRTGKLRKQEKENREKAVGLLEFVGLKEKLDEKATNLPYGQQRLLEIARALATNPKLLLLDEPVAGMNEKESGEVAKLIYRIRDKGITVILIEHDMKFVMNLCNKVTVLNSGALIAEGTPKEVQTNKDVIQCYLGKRGAKNVAAS